MKLAAQRIAAAQEQPLFLAQPEKERQQQGTNRETNAKSDDGAPRVAIN
jgi:hypothetical protein